MKLHHIPIDQLAISPLNMRHGRKPPDVDDLLPSIREKGILTPLLVCPGEDSEQFRIIAGRRRYHAAKRLGTICTLPCIVQGAISDADALEISLIENFARLDPDPMIEYEAFAKLARKGRSVAEIAALFGLDEARVNQRLALGNLLTPIRKAYCAGDLDPASLQALTLATKAKQRDWLALFRDPDQRAPTGHRLKSWLFGGQSIATSAALFDLADYCGEIVTDLFDETAYFADSEAFWDAQMKAVEALRERYLAEGWPKVETFGPDDHFSIWSYEKRSKAQGGHVIIDIARTGEVAVHEGYLSQREIARQNKAGDSLTAEARTPARELTAKLENYCALHRHGMVRTALLSSPQLALRLLTAHLLAGSDLWSVRADPQRAACGPTAKSIEAASYTSDFERERSAICDLLDIPFDASPLVNTHGSSQNLARLFARLETLDDTAILRILTFAMAESLCAGGIGVELAGARLGIDARAHWQPDDAFFALLRDKAAINAMLAETRSARFARSRASRTRKQQIDALQSVLATHAQPWVPRYLAFPFSTYSQKSGGLFDRLNAVIDDLATPEADGAPETRGKAA
jgi:ParB family chromosome partitioning protein